MDSSAHAPHTMSWICLRDYKVPSEICFVCVAACKNNVDIYTHFQLIISAFEWSFSRVLVLVLMPCTMYKWHDSSLVASVTSVHTL